MIVVDSSVWVDYFNGIVTSQTDALDSLLARELVLMGDLILTEVLQGFRSDRDFRRARQLFEPLAFSSMLGKRVAIESASNYRRLRRRGVTVRKTIDVIIATFCILNGHRLLHSDRDFDVMEAHLGLAVLTAG
ncbi:MAG: type II toxin-antitoxin system VapC family toxin [Gammaproteobacteria bacterium]